MATAAELNALPYSGGPATGQGIDGSTFRQEMRNHGEEIRGWWRSYRNMLGVADAATRQGLLFVQQAVGSAVRVQMYQNKKQVQTEDGFIIGIGTSMIACMPDEIWLRRNDRILSNRAELAEGEAMESDGQLGHEFPAAILKITSLTDGVIAGNRYSLNGRSLTWTGSPPSGLLLVDYTYYKFYEVDGVENRQAPKGSDSVRLPQHCSLRLLSVGEEGM